MKTLYELSQQYNALSNQCRNISSECDKYQEQCKKKKKHIRLSYVNKCADKLNSLHIEMQELNQKMRDLE